jgi:hypothetical protein
VANFIDAETMRKFHREKVDLSPAVYSEVANSGGVLCRLAETLAPADDTARTNMEARRRQLRENFLRARTY